MREKKAKSYVIFQYAQTTGSQNNAKL